MTATEGAENRLESASIRGGIAALGVMAAAGIPLPMVSECADATALRQFVHVTLQPVLRIVAAELSRVLELELALDLAPLAAADVQCRSMGLPGAGRQRHGTGAGSGRSAPADGHGLMASCLTVAEPLASPAAVRAWGWAAAVRAWWGAAVRAWRRPIRLGSCSTLPRKTGAAYR